MTCNFRHPMSLRHTVVYFGRILCSMRSKYKGVVPWDMRRPCIPGAHAMIVVCLFAMCMFECATAAPPYQSPTTHGDRKLLSSFDTSTSVLSTTPPPPSSGGIFYFWNAAPWVTRFTMLGLAGIVVALSITIAVLAKEHTRFLKEHSEQVYSEVQDEEKQ